jgi:hypothetical protein
VSDLIAFRAPAELKERLQAEAKDRGMSMSALIVERLVTAGEVTRVSVAEMFADPDVTPLVRVQPKTPLDVVHPPSDGGCSHPKDQKRHTMAGLKCLKCGEILVPR